MAVFVTGDGVAAVVPTLIVTVASAPAAIVPRLHETVPADGAQLPWLDVDER